MGKVQKTLWLHRTSSLALAPVVHRISSILGRTRSSWAVLRGIGVWKDFEFLKVPDPKSHLILKGGLLVPLTHKVRYRY